MSKPEIVVTADVDEYARTAAQMIGNKIEEATSRKGACSIALSGGKSPVPVYKQLAQMSSIPWDEVEVYFADERCVPPDHPESNYRLAKETLLDHVPIPEEQIHRMAGEHDDPEQAAVDYEAVLPAELDVLVLGMGEDCHTASIFPGSPLAMEQLMRVSAASAMTEPIRRITITPPAIAAARSIFVLISGSAKAQAVARALSEPHDPSKMPVHLASEGTWILDAAAAEMLADETKITTEGK